jgi:hypothetical protein
MGARESNRASLINRSKRTMRTLTTIMLTLAMITAAGTQAANARSLEKTCILVDNDHNSPTVILSGHITRNHRTAFPKNSERFAFPGFYLKLDSPLRVDNGGGCYDLDEIPITSMSTASRGRGPDDLEPDGAIGELVEWNN